MRRRARVPENLRGRSFGRLFVLALDRQEDGVAWWICLCACGHSGSYPGCKLKRGDYQSCGCWRRDRMAAMNRRRRDPVVG